MPVSTPAGERTTTARPDDADFLSSPYLTEDGCSTLPVVLRDAVIRRRRDFVFALVRRRNLASASRHISGQALAAIVLGSTVVLCALLGCCLMRLPASCSSLRGCLGSSSSSSSGVGTSDAARDTPTGLERFDAELGIRPVRLARGLSPPPPYSRAPSYESSGSTGGREACPNSTNTLS